MKIAGILGIGAAVLLVLALVTMPLYTDVTNPGQIGLAYEGGPIEGKGGYIKTVTPGSGRVITGMMNPVYHYPTTKRTYIISKNADEGDVAGKDSVGAPSRDGITMTYQVAVYFTLNKDRVKQFHEEVGLKYAAYEDDGWDHMLKEIFRQQIESALQKETRNHEAIDIFSNRKVMDEIETNIRKSLKDRINDSLGDNYFCGVSPTECDDFGFVIKKVEVPSGVLQALQNNRTSEIEVKTKQNEIAQKKAEAQAIQELQKVLESCGQVCVLNKAVESGAIDFWVLPSGTSVIKGQ